MGWLNFKRTSTDSQAAPTLPSADAVQAARVRARRRLIGATVLLAIGIIAFPLVFETQPRPIPVDLPIEIPAKDNAPALVAPQAKASALRPAQPDPETVAPAEPLPSPTPDRAERDPGQNVTAPVADLPPRVASDASPVPKIAAAGSHPPNPKVTAAVTAAAKTVPAPAPTAVTARPPASAKSAEAVADADRFVVQVAAFADVNLAHEARLKVEKLGLKTYTQVVDTPAGKRVRVRVGPFPDKAQADQAAAKIKSGGLPAAVLTL